ncbi:MAG: prepilin-type N-terminal cleavage/methylation domain-containing protein [Gammaproteobacteria bacterium]|nr:prepilin-type N-terminal cleavage/methylation domain-containing protein [Gammaproteobacteria bacterium]
MPSATAFSRAGPARAGLPTRLRGFTIIEIMLAAVILAILGAIAVPMYENYITEARIATAIRDIRQISLILDDRFLDNDPPATLADVGVDLVDPWGNAYEYLWLRGNPAPGLNGKRRRDKSMNPVNTDYDLYSRGPDGKTTAQFTAGKARDDIVRANDGDFVGLASDH